jgi:hypothetical protein
MDEKKSTIKVDLTPPAAKTPEGAARINKAVEALDSLNSQCALFLDDMHQHYREIVRKALIPMFDHDEKEVDEYMKDWDELVEARSNAYDELCKAITGR